MIIFWRLQTMSGVNMKIENIANLNLFNYFAIQYLESVGNLYPQDSEVERMEHLMKQWFVMKMSGMLNELKHQHLSLQEMFPETH